VLGKTPFQHARARAAGVEVLALRHEGYAVQRVPLDTSRDITRSVTLTPLAAPPPPPAPPAVKEAAAGDAADQPKKGHRAKKEKTAKHRRVRKGRH
jgi:hypothetical protein